MTKHLGTIVVWIVGAGILLYAVRHVGDLFDGLGYLWELIKDQRLIDRVNDLFQ